MYVARYNIVAKSHFAILHIMFHISSESTFVMVTRRFTPWRLYTSVELYESRYNNNSRSDS